MRGLDWDEKRAPQAGPLNTAMNAARGVAFLFLLAISGAVRAEVTIARAEPVIQRRTFDRKNPPADMPRLHPNEAAVTQSLFGVESRLGGQVLEQTRTG